MISKLSCTLTAALLLLGGSLATPLRAETVLNVATAGDQNMVDYINDYLGPKFEAANPGVSVKQSAQARAMPVRSRYSRSLTRRRKQAPHPGTSMSPWCTSAAQRK